MTKIVSRGDPIEPIYLNNLRVAAHGWGVVSGLAVSQRGAGANMSVDVASGAAWINGETFTKSAITNVAITTAHASYDRYDLVVINSSGTISVIDGTAGATSYANDYDLETNNAILLAEVEVPATDTMIENAQITDKRINSYMDEMQLDYLTPALFQVNPAFGTFNQNPEKINDNVTISGLAIAINVNEYAEVVFSAVSRIKQYRMRGAAGHAGDGAWKIQQWAHGAWVDNTTGIALHNAESWTSLTSLTTEVWTTKIRFVATTIDTGANQSALRELEIIGT